MGSQNSKEGEKEQASWHGLGPFETFATAFSATLPKSMNMRTHVNKLNPAVALQTLMKPGQRVVKQGAHHLKNIFATPFDLLTYQPPTFAKSKPEQDFIRQALSQNFVFSGVATETLSALVLAFEKFEAVAGSVLIQQGDQGDYFYILYKGTCTFQVNGNAVGEARPGDSFGELALLYTCPRAATVQAVTDVTVFRVDQKSFRYLLRQQRVDSEKEKLDLLAKIPFLADLHPTDLQKLADVMTPRHFHEGQKKFVGPGGQAEFFFVLQSGRIRVTNIKVGGASYADHVLEAGSYGGEQVILMNAENTFDAVAETDGLVFVIDMATFQKVMGSHAQMVLRSTDKKKLVRWHYLCRCCHYRLHCCCCCFRVRVYPQRF
jgi:cAMP-dependent protein kinase regulator